MIIEPTIISIIVAKFRKGKFRNLEKLDIKACYLLLAAAGIQIISSITKKNNLLQDGLIYLHILSYILIIICLLLNIKRNSMKAFLIGVILNFIVIFANGGMMPVSLDGIMGINDNISVELPVSGYNIKHQGLSPDTKFVYLADIILIAKPYPFPKILSVGDIFIMIGLFIFIQEAMIIDDKKDPNCNDV